MSESPPYDPRAVANLMLDLADDAGIVVSNLALQKLLYFAHGHYLMRTERPLIQGAFEAWANGPVHPAAYHAFKSAGSNPITQRATGRNVMTGEARTLATPTDPEAIAHVRLVLQAYGHLSPGLLVAISHAPGSPWAVVKERVANSTSLGSRIPDSLTRQRFGRQKVEVGASTGIDESVEDSPLSGNMFGASV